MMIFFLLSNSTNNSSDQNSAMRLLDNKAADASLIPGKKTKLLVY